MTAQQPADDAALNDVFAFDRDRKPSAEGKNTRPEAAPPAPVENAITQAVEAVNEQRMVPLAELTNERKKLKGERDEARRLAAEAQGRAHALEEFYARQREPADAQRQNVKVPDPTLEPEQYAAFVAAASQSAIANERLHASEDRARDKYGDELVNEAFQAADKAGLVARRHFQQSNPRHPWGALVEWFQQQKVVSEIGLDPKAYEEKLRAKFLEELKAQGQTLDQSPAAAKEPQRFPGTIADKTASGPQGSHLTDEAAMAGVFSSNRKRK